VTEKEQLIDALIAPLEDNAEQQLHARGLLEDAIEDNAVTLPAASEWMRQARDSRKRRIVLWGLFLLAFVGILYPILTTYGMRSGLKQYRAMTSFGMSAPPQVPTLTAEEKFLLYGDLSRSKTSEKRRALWEREPKNPAFFAEYATHYISESGSLPPDFLQTAAELDPENGWYLATAAAAKSKGVCRKEKTIHPRCSITSAQVAAMPREERRKMERKIVYEYTIVNPVAMQEVLDLWRQSLKYQLYENYAVPLHQMRYPILSRHDSFINYTNSLAYVFGLPSVLLQKRYLCDVLVTALQKADMQSDEGKQHFRDVNHYLESIAAHEPAYLVDSLIKRAIITEIVKQIDVIDTSALDPAMVDSWRQRNEAMQQLTDKLKQQPDPQSDFIRNHGSMLTAIIVPALQKQTTDTLLLSTEDLKPMRYMEHSLFLFLIAAVCSLLLLILVPYHSWGRNKKLTHRLSDAIWLAMPWRSLGMLILWSVAAPLFYFAALTLWSPMTGKEYGTGMGFLFPLCPAISVALMLLLLPRLLVHRFTAAWQQLHLARKPWYLRLGWTAFVLLLLPLHLLPTVTQASKTHVFGLALLGVCWLPAILWLLWTLEGGLFARNFYPAVMHGLRRRAVGACTLTAIVLLSLTCWVMKQCERYWLQKDTIMAISREKPTLRYEAEITKRAYAEWNQFFR
jgi:hypothetical protein